MTKSGFRDTVLQIARAFGRGVPSDPAVVDGIVVERLRAFTETTRCLYTMDCGVTLSAGVSDYSLEGPAFALPMADIDILLIEGAAIGKSEPLDFATMFSASSATGPVGGYTILPGKVLRVAPIPDAAYTGRAVGPRLHKNLTVGPDGDDEEIEIPSAYIRTAASFCAVPLAFPHAVGREDMELLAVLDKAAVVDMDRLKHDSVKLRHGKMVRGWKKRFGSIDLS